MRTIQALTLGVVLVLLGSCQKREMEEAPSATVPSEAPAPRATLHLRRRLRLPAQSRSRHGSGRQPRAGHPAQADPHVQPAARSAQHRGGGEQDPGARLAPRRLRGERQRPAPGRALLLLADRAGAGGAGRGSHGGHPRARRRASTASSSRSRTSPTSTSTSTPACARWRPPRPSCGPCSPIAAAGAQGDGDHGVYREAGGDPLADRADPHPAQLLRQARRPLDDQPRAGAHRGRQARGAGPGEWHPADTMRSSARALVGFLRWFLDFAIFAIIVLLPIGLIVVVALALRRLWRRARKARKEEPAPPPEGGSS